MATEEEAKLREERAQKAAQLREELKNGRRNTEATEDALRYAEFGDREVGGSVKVLSGESRRTKQGAGQYGNTHGVTQKSGVRPGRAGGRFNANNGSADEDVSSQSGRRAGRLEALDPIPDRLPEKEEEKSERKFFKDDFRRSTRGGQKVWVCIDNPDYCISEEDRKKLPSRKKSTFGKIKDAIKGEFPEPIEKTIPIQSEPVKKSKNIFGIGKSGTVLSQAEIAKIKEPFIAALKDDCKYLDEFLWWYSKDTTQPQIWSDLDDEEIQILARMLLRRGERSPAAADLVRNIVDGSDYISTAVIVVPRMIKTTQQLSKRPKKQRSKA